MSAMRAKLKDQRGASITYALLIFLICAVASSIIIVASSAAAGRMANVPRSDRRYYAVTSAAGLLKGEIDGKTVVVTKKVTKGAEDSGSDKVDYTPNEPDSVLTDATLKLVKGETAQTNYTLTATGYEALNCGIKQKIENGLLVYTITNNGYTLEIVFGSNMKESTREIGTGVTQTTSTVQWKFHSMQKMVSKPTAAPTEGT